MIQPEMDYGSIATQGTDETASSKKQLITPLTTAVKNSPPKNVANKTLANASIFVMFVTFIAITCIVIYTLNPSFVDKSVSSSSSNAFLSLPAASPEKTFLASPEKAFGFKGVYRKNGAEPSNIWSTKKPIPTNSFYLNLLSHKASLKPDDMCRVYTVPYIIDTAPHHGMAGIRVHWPVVKAYSTNVQMINDFKNGVSLGSSNVSSKYKVDDLEELSNLGVSLKWGDVKSNKKMVTHIVRGMPYATMKYYGYAFPEFHSYNAPASLPLIDGEKEFKCEGNAASILVKREIQLHFRNSDFTWALFFSKPVKVNCKVIGDDINVAEFELQAHNYGGFNGVPLIVRLALIDQCTTGNSDIYQHCQDKADWNDQEGYIKLLQERAHIFPTSPTIEFQYPDDSSSGLIKNVQIDIDWKAKPDNDDKSLIMFALPHHQKILKEKVSSFCLPTFHGPTCLVQGSTWTLTEDININVSFTAGRPPEAEMIPYLAKALSNDIHYRLADNMMRAALDTYFSGKILARVARVIAITTELKTLAEGSLKTIRPLYDENVSNDALSASIEAAKIASLPSKQDIKKSVEMLRKGVDVWLSTDAEATFVYDKSWGGLVNCGCNYTTNDQYGHCNNKFPNCPALESVNEDFGNGFYNDHHFHYGYNVYAAALVAKHDPIWAMKNFDRIMLYIRDFANPFPNDAFFPYFRQKDWFLGNSWAAGIVSAENSPHGRNQESSSEAIAAYEGVALFGTTMVDIFKKEKKEQSEHLKVATLVMNAGKLLTSTELKAANRYWHVWSSDNHINTYPKAYDKLVVGMLYETMASFQTWFAPDAVVSYGIQLMPFTSIAEYRDDPTWATELYPLYEKSCEKSGDFCVDNGWSILQAGLLATTGKRKEALKQALAVPTKVFSSYGGMGNSLSNTIWYIATRKSI